ncbi:hypothetical protein [Sphaerisporangium perillae]|uniref:hypothetical protein n=1 Tax=Sphaerisporangium perillae TaxID=2935860 RepID=UPI00200E84B9|nr:hypothetical protein [Sphaerisporangium perillae]
MIEPVHTPAVMEDDPAVPPPAGDEGLVVTAEPAPELFRWQVEQVVGLIGRDRTSPVVVPAEQRKRGDCVGGDE